MRELISVVTPAFNEAENLPLLYARLAKLARVFSENKTAQLTALCDPRPDRLLQSLQRWPGTRG